MNHIDPHMLALFICAVAWCVMDYRLKRRDNADT
jgi:hypothetical protein